MRIKTKEEIKEALYTISSKYSVQGAMPDLIIDLLTYYIEQNQANLTAIGLEGNLDTAENWDNIISLCGSLMYSVARPRLAKIGIPTWYMHSDAKTDSEFSDKGKWKTSGGTNQGTPYFTNYEAPEDFGERYLADYTIEKAKEIATAEAYVNPVFKSFYDHFQQMPFDKDDVIYQAMNGHAKGDHIAVGENAELVFDRVISPSLTDPSKTIFVEPNPTARERGKMVTMEWAARDATKVATIADGKVASTLSFQMHGETSGASGSTKCFCANFNWSVFVADLCGAKHSFSMKGSEVSNNEVYAEFKNLSAYSEPNDALKAIIVESYKEYSDRTQGTKPAIYMMTTPGYGVKFIGNQYVPNDDTEYAIDLYEYVEPTKENMSDLIISGNDFELEVGRDLDNIATFGEESEYLAQLEACRQISVGKHQEYQGDSELDHTSFFTHTNAYTTFFSIHTSSAVIIDNNVGIETKNDAKRRAWTNSKIASGIGSLEDCVNYVFSLNRKIKAVKGMEDATEKVVKFYYSNDSIEPLSADDITSLTEAVKATAYGASRADYTICFFKAARCQPAPSSYTTLTYAGNELSPKQIAEVRSRLANIILDGRRNLTAAALVQPDNSINCWSGDGNLGPSRLQQLMAIVLKEYGCYMLHWEMYDRNTFNLRVKWWRSDGSGDNEQTADLNTPSGYANVYAHSELTGNSAMGKEFTYDFTNTESLVFVWQPL